VLVASSTLLRDVFDDSVLSSAFFLCRLASRAAFSRQITKQHPTRAATNILMADVTWAAVTCHIYLEYNLSAIGPYLMINNAYKQSMARRRMHCSLVQ
jgi:hypothetical protein